MMSEFSLIWYNPTNESFRFWTQNQTQFRLLARRSPGRSMDCIWRHFHANMIFGHSRYSFGNRLIGTAPRYIGPLVRVSDLSGRQAVSAGLQTQRCRESDFQLLVADLFRLLAQKFGTVCQLKSRHHHLFQFCIDVLKLIYLVCCTSVKNNKINRR